jgi:hypothetical protein
MIRRLSNDGSTAPAEDEPEFPMCIVEVGSWYHEQCVSTVNVNLA